MYNIFTMSTIENPNDPNEGRKRSERPSRFDWLGNITPLFEFRL